MRTPFMAGNWKMYKTAAETTAFFDQFRPLVAQTNGREIVICPTFPNLPAAVAATQGSNIQIGAQNVFWEKEGAYTGEVSASMLAAVGCRYVIIGHSERRQYFHETDETVFKRTLAALAAGLTPIVCVGELLSEREAGQTEAVLLRQFQGGLGELEPDQFARVIIAYEPVWAIGTGKTATPAMAQQAHAFLRKLAADQYGDPIAAGLRILYGGSVKPNNVKELMNEPDVDGALVGGASLEPQSFAAIVNF